MQFYDFIATRSFSSFKKSFTRSIVRLAIVATSLSLTVMIVAQSIFNGFQGEIAKKVFGFWGHIHITDIQSSQSLEPYSISLTDSMRSVILQSGTKIKGDASIQHVQAFIIYPAILNHRELSDGLFVKGVGHDFKWEFFKNFLVHGNILPSSSDSSYSRNILISEETAKNLQLSIGSTVVLNLFVHQEILKRKVTVSGIYNTGLAEYDKKFAIVDIRLLQKALGKNEIEVSGIEVFCKDVLLADQVNQNLFEHVLPETWYSETIRLKFPHIFEWLALQDITKYFILLLILAVCIINMATTLMILILERTHMIGVLSVLGMKKWDQRKIFLRYAVTIISWSLLIGNIIGYSLILIQHHFKLIKLSEADYYLTHAPVDLNPIPVIILNLIFFLVILISLVLPSWLVSFIKPVNAIKFR